MNPQITVREIHEGKSKICEVLLRSLPGWFGIESAIQEYVRGVESMPMFVAFENERAAGFLSLKNHNEFTSEIYVMAVDPAIHRRGVGRHLLAACEKYLKRHSFKFLTVKTLSSSRPDPHYDKTREFYLSMGFIPLEEFKSLWGERNPCLFLVKGLE